MYWKQAARGNATTLIAFLHQLHQSFPDQLLVVILDHCSIHKSKKVKTFVAQTVWLELEHLAPYSPEYNPIERFWHWLKRKVYGGKSYKTMHDVMSEDSHSCRTSASSSLIWHYNGV
jgi:transposase